MDGVILVCFRVSDLGEDHDPSSFIDRCTACREDIYVAPGTLEDIAQHHPGETPLLLCSKCAPDIAQSMGAEWADTPQQRAAWQLVRDEVGDPIARMMRSVLRHD